MRRLSGKDVRVAVLFTGIMMLILAGGCASTPSYEGAFSAGQQVQGNTESISASMEATWVGALETLSQQGFLVQQSDEKSRTILASRELRDQKDKDISYTVTATLTFVPLADQTTRVMLAANQTTELHRKRYEWWHLLWIIPIFPVGTDYTTVVVNRDTVRSPQFYSDFFSALKKSVEEKSAPIPVPFPESPAITTPTPPVAPESVTE